MLNTDRIKCFAINVDTNEYKRRHILSQSEAAGIDIHIFNAVTPDTSKSIPNAYNPIKARRFTGRPLMPTELACGLSHISLWRKLQNDKNHEFYLILEDDVFINDNIACLINKVDLSAIDMLKLSGQQKRPVLKISKLYGNYALYRFAFGPLDAAAYIISKQGAKEMDSYCQSLYAPIDVLIDRSYDHGIQIYGIMPYPVTTRFHFDQSDPLFTDVGVRNKKYAEDITLFEKLAVRAQRLQGSAKRLMATIKLRLQHKQSQ